MVKFLKDNYERILVILAVIGLLALTGSFVWGGRILTVQFNKALKVEGGGSETVEFNIEGARSLNLEISR